MSGQFDSSIGRWAGVGPYYAMFPVQFAYEIIRKYSNPGDHVLDPFAGRASSVYAAATQGRFGVGIEINPVGWLYGRVKLSPANKADVLDSLLRVTEWAYSREVQTDTARLPTFFHWCYSTEVLQFLVAARKNIDWKHRRADSTLMAFILIYLHGKLGQSLSNQMRQSKAMSPDYSVRWWKARKMKPPVIEPLSFLAERIEWRYAKGNHSFSGNTVMLGDSTKILPKLAKHGGPPKRFGLLFTSPPYSDVTNYYYDQWLRLWMLGGPSLPERQEGEHRAKFVSKPGYERLLSDVFAHSAELMTKNATVYVRTDAREFTLHATISSLKKAFPGRNYRLIRRPYKRATQTALFGDTQEKPGEVDILVN